MINYDYTNATSGALYYDNVRFTSGQVNTAWQAQAGLSADGTYHWGLIPNFTPYNQATGTGGMPCNPGDIVTFGYQNIPAGVTEQVALDATEEFQISVGTMIFDNANSSYVISQGTGGALSTLTLNGNIYNPDGSVTAGTSSINDQEGNHTISAPVALATDTTISVGVVNNVFTISGNISGASSLTIAPTSYSAGVGTVLLSGSNSYSGGTYISSGTLVAADTNQSLTASSTGTGNVQLNGGVLASLPGRHRIFSVPSSAEAPPLTPSPPAASEPSAASPSAD